MSQRTIADEVEIVSTRFQFYLLTHKDTFGYEMMPIKSEEYKAVNRNFMNTSIDELSVKVRDLVERPMLSHSLCKTLSLLNSNYEKYLEREGRLAFDAP